MDSNDYIRTRSICLKKTADGQAREACNILQRVSGIHSVSAMTKHRLKMTYSLEFLTFELVEGLLKELGLELDQSFPAYVRRYYYQYAEDNVRESLMMNAEKHHLVCRLSDVDKPEQYWDQYH